MTNEDLTVYPLAGLGAAEGFYKYYLRPSLTATKGWAAVAGLVVAWDLFGAQTLTNGCHEAIRSHPLLTRAVIGGVALHLASPKYDPFQLAYDIFK